MGTIGLNFGSPTSGQGFDVTATVTQIVTGYQAVESPWKDRLTTLGAQDTAFTQIGADLSTLATKLTALTDFQGALAAKQGASSNSSVLALTAAQASATAGSHTVLVSRLAQSSSQFSDTVANAQTTFTGTFTLQTGSATPLVLTLDPAGETLQSIAARINGAGLGATANVITDASGARLSLVSNATGVANALSLTANLSDGTNALNFQVGQTAQDAQLTVDGVALTESSNSVSNAIPGVTFQLLAADPSNAVQVQITNDTNAISTAMSDLVAAYNVVAKDLSAQEGKDSTGHAKPLFGDPDLNLLQQQLASAITASSGTGITDFSALGVSINGDGTLKLDADAFRNAVGSNFAGVTSFFQDTGSVGAAFTQTLARLSSSDPSGVVYQALQANQSQEKDLNQNITKEEQIIAQKKTVLVQQLQQANFALQQIPSQLNFVNELYAAITGFNGGKQ